MHSVSRGESVCSYEWLWDQQMLVCEIGMDQHENMAHTLLPSLSHWTRLTMTLQPKYVPSTPIILAQTQNGPLTLLLLSAKLLFFYYNSSFSTNLFIDNIYNILTLLIRGKLLRLGSNWVVEHMIEFVAWNIVRPFLKWSYPFFCSTLFLLFLSLNKSSTRWTFKLNILSSQKNHILHKNRYCLDIKGKKNNKHLDVISFIHVCDRNITGGKKMESKEKEEF